MDGRKDGQMERRMDGWADGWMRRRMGGWKEGWTDKQEFVVGTGCCDYRGRKVLPSVICNLEAQGGL